MFHFRCIFFLMFETIPFWSFSSVPFAISQMFWCWQLPIWKLQAMNLSAPVNLMISCDGFLSLSGRIFSCHPLPEWMILSVVTWVSKHLKWPEIELIVQQAIYTTTQQDITKYDLKFTSHKILPYWQDDIILKLTSGAQRDREHFLIDE